MVVVVVAVSKVRSWWWWCLRSGHGGGRGGSPRCIMHLHDALVASDVCGCIVLLHRTIRQAGNTTR